jgi:tRNA U55 pseudouridine synthase TruB
MDLPVVQLRIFCSAGTYIRALARDIGQAIGCGACLKSLCREQSGIFTIAKALSLPTIESSIKSGQLPEILLAPQDVLQANIISLDLPAAIMIAQGRSLAITTNDSSSNQLCLAVYAGNSSTHPPQTVALCSVAGNKLIEPKVVLASPDDLDN